jgi:hypothetical protein
MRIRLYIYYTIFLIVVFNTVNGQENNPYDSSQISIKKEQKYSYVEAGINYISDIVFMGRRDSVAVPYFSPSFTYYNKSGLFASASFSYLTSSEQQRIDLYTLSLGYHTKFNNWFAGALITKYFFNDQSYNVESELSGYGNAYLGHHFGNALNWYVDGMLSFASQPDFFISTELSHDFYLLQNELSISPTLQLNAGTQNYYNAYYTTRRYSNKRDTNSSGNGQGGNGQGSGSGNTSSIPTSIMVQSASAFQLLNVGVSMPIIYDLPHFTISLNPQIAFPLNPSSITLDGVTIKENLSNYFYWSISVNYRFFK